MIGLFKKKPPIEPQENAQLAEDELVARYSVELYRSIDGKMFTNIKANYPHEVAVLSILSTELEVAKLRMLEKYDGLMSLYRDKIDKDNYC